MYPLIICSVFFSHAFLFFPDACLCVGVGAGCLRLRQNDGAACNGDDPYSTHQVGHHAQQGGAGQEGHGCRPRRRFGQVRIARPASEDATIAVLRQQLLASSLFEWSLLVTYLMV